MHWSTKGLDFTVVLSSFVGDDRAKPLGTWLLLDSPHSTLPRAGCSRSSTIQLSPYGRPLPCCHNQLCPSDRPPCDSREICRRRSKCGRAHPGPPKPDCRCGQSMRLSWWGACKL